jgi:type II secretory ATPase GspE/PulE/Tfp pilus assembly ATPase PilB-like protein
MMRRSIDSRKPVERRSVFAGMGATKVSPIPMRASKNREVVRAIGSLGYGTLTSDVDLLALLQLTDTEKPHPIVVLSDLKVLVVESPERNENELIRTVRKKVNELRQAEGLAEVPETVVERGVLDSFISAKTRQLEKVGVAGISENELCESILSRASELRATDIHLDIMLAECSVRYRVNGVLSYRTNMDSATGSKIINAFWVSYAHSQLNADLVKDGRFTRTTGGVNYLYRLSYGSTPELGVATLAIRVRDMDDIPRLSDLGYNDRQMALFRKSQGRAGMVMVCGSVNSGKSTFQAAWQSELPDDQFNLEVSDQVEVNLPNFTQMQKPESLQASLKKEVNHRLFKLPTRHDIDFIAINEIRDFETGQLMQDLMQLGTPGITALHAKGWAEAVNRLVSPKIGVDPVTLHGEGFFNAIMYQTLARVLCECKLSVHPDQYTDEYFSQVLGAGLRFRNPTGCQKCGNSGIAGLTAVAEFLPIEDGNRELLKDTTNSRAMYEWMKENDVPNIFQHALEKVKSGSVDPQMIQQKLGEFSEKNIFDEFTPEKP